MKTLYFDCFAGASGNMILGGLIALGVDKNVLVKEIQRLGAAEFSIEVESVDRSGISGTHVNVIIPEEKSHRHLHNIEKIIMDSTLSEAVKERSLAIFTRLAEAEAKVHGIDVKKVHFHEVGAMDAIIDVVGSCIGFEMLGVERFVCSKIHTGSGFVQMAHGKYPVPPPAVAELLRGIPMYSTEIEGELITPTGAAVISSVCDSYGKIPEMIVEQTGYGAGTREYSAFANVLRLMLGETAERPADSKTAELVDDDGSITEALVLLETNIDDISPQVLAYAMERCFELGALDSWFTPIQMKKNRPATQLSVLCNAQSTDLIIAMLYRETSTLGIRTTKVDRRSMPREISRVTTEFGNIDVKIARLGAEVVNVMPEYEQVRQLAIENKVPFRVVQEAAIAKSKVLTLSASNNK